MNIGIIEIFISFASGLFAGLFYFGLLWLSVRSLSQLRYPFLVSFGGFFLRITGVVVIFYLIAVSIGWVGMLIGLLGFIIMKLIFIGRYRPIKGKIEEA